RGDRRHRRGHVQNVFTAGDGFGPTVVTLEVGGQEREPVIGFPARALEDGAYTRFTLERTNRRPDDVPGLEELENDVTAEEPRTTRHENGTHCGDLAEAVPSRAGNNSCPRHEMMMRPASNLRYHRSGVAIAPSPVRDALKCPNRRKLSRWKNRMAHCSSTELESRVAVLGALPAEGQILRHTNVVQQLTGLAGDVRTHVPGLRQRKQRARRQLGHVLRPRLARRRLRLDPCKVLGAEVAQAVGDPVSLQLGAARAVAG